MGIKKIKKENDYLNISLIDMISKFDPSETKKYTQFLVNILKKELKEREFGFYLDKRDNVEKQVKADSIENKLSRLICCDYLFGKINIENFLELCSLMDRGLVEENDISKYNSWDMVEEQLYHAKNREAFKKAKKEIKVIYENDDYLILKPLTHQASCAYGYNTKWCTAMINDPEYFYNHSKGVLIYVMDKKQNQKFGFYKELPEDGPRLEPNFGGNEDLTFKIYNEKDDRIDSFQTGIPRDILELIANEMDTKNSLTTPNHKLFSNDEIKKMLKYTLTEGEVGLVRELVNTAPRPLEPIQMDPVTRTINRMTTTTGPATTRFNLLYNPE
jgi:hypothetical protein